LLIVTDVALMLKFVFYSILEYLVITSSCNLSPYRAARAANREQTGSSHSITAMHYFCSQEPYGGYNGGL
jgi:hypothetical protein